MAQNRSNAVMASRVEAHDSLDHFPTPPWATRALCEWLKKTCGPIDHDTCWEPACAEGHMSRALAEYFGEVYSSDVYDYGFGKVEDFLFPTERIVDFAVTNPPFRLAAQFVVKMQAVSRIGAAILVRTAFLESADRYVNLFGLMPPSEILQFVERVPMLKGRLDRAGSTATAYCWLLWRQDAEATHGTRFHWIAPCRRRLERDEDYPTIKAAAE